MHHLPVRTLCFAVLLGLTAGTAAPQASGATRSNWPGWRGDGTGVSAEMAIAQKSYFR